MEAKKSLGQNFLRDPKILKKIVDFAKIEKEDTVLEVGPGEGALTKFLLERAARVVAIEKDGLLAEKLKEKFESEIKSGKLDMRLFRFNIFLANLFPFHQIKLQLITKSIKKNS